MAIKRYEETDQIVGQFLPKIYTRRITLESVLQGTDLESSETSVTVECQIKDILDENGIGVITKNSDSLDNSQVDILSALKIALIVFKDKQVASSFSTAIGGLEDNTTYNQLDMIDAINRMILELNLSPGGVKALASIKDAAGSHSQGRNFLYESQDSNNNPINVLPYTYNVKLRNQLWNNCDNLCLVAFAFFDFKSLDLTGDGLSDNAARKLGYLTGNITLDVITRDGKVKSTARVFREQGTNKPYYGPVHYHSNENPGPDGYIGYMVGLPGGDMGPKLYETQVPVTKIQDFRGIQRTKMVNYQPNQLEYFNGKKPNMSFLEKRYKNYFGLTNVSVDYDRSKRYTELEFTINTKDIFKNNSKYFDFLNQIPAFQTNSLPLSDLMKFLDIRVVRRRVTERFVSNDKLGMPKRKEFNNNEMDHLVINTSEGLQANELNSTIIEKENDFGFIREVGSTSTTKTFEVRDYQIAELHNTDGVYQYGIEIKLLDTTKSFLLQRLESGRELLKTLKLYADEAKIPVMNVGNVNTTNYGDIPQGLGTNDVPSYVDSVMLGNYDYKTNTFTREFVRKANRRYGPFGKYAINMMMLVYWSFGRTAVSLTKSSVSSVQTNDHESAVTPQSSLETLFGTSGEGLERDAENATLMTLINMINPSNARPESIDSFIRSYEDLVLEMEDFLGVDHLASLSNEGSGYSAKGDQSFTVKRWISNSDVLNGEIVDEDTFVELDVVNNSIWWAGLLDGIGSIATLANPDYSNLIRSRLDYEVQRYDLLPDAPVVMAPTFLNLGSWRIYFDPDLMETDRARQRQESLVSASPFVPSVFSKYIYLDPSALSNVSAVNNFVDSIYDLRFAGGSTSAKQLIDVVNSLDHTNFFSGLMSVTEYMEDNIILYSGDTFEQPLSVPLAEDAFSNTGECRIEDNTPLPNLVLFRDNLGNFLNDQDFIGNLGYSQIDRFIHIFRPGDLVSNVAPQLASAAFPTGGIFDQSLRVVADMNSNALSVGDLTTSLSLGGLSRVSMGNLNVATNNQFSKDLSKNILGGSTGAKGMSKKLTKSKVPIAKSTFKIKTTTMVPVTPGNASGNSNTGRFAGATPIGNSSPATAGIASTVAGVSNSGVSSTAAGAISARSGLGLTRAQGTVNPDGSSLGGTGIGIAGTY